MADQPSPSELADAQDDHAHGAEDAHGAADALDPHHLFEHVQDAEYFHFPQGLGGHLYLPQPLKTEEPIVQARTGVDLLDQVIHPLDLKLTKFMVLEVVAAIILVFIFGSLAGKLSRGKAPRGRLTNMFEAMLLFIRDEVARPAIGKHDADRFVPFLWTLFFFVLMCNLLGMVPWMGSPTGSLAVTGALALITFLTVVGTGMMKLGALGFWKAQVPHMDLSLELGGINFEPVLKVVLIPMIFAIEILGLLIRHFVLAVRLLANMFAGHLVLGVILAFIGATGGLVWYGVMPASVLGATALSLLELFVAFLQAYIFAFLSALFIGAAVHPH